MNKKREVSGFLSKIENRILVICCTVLSVFQTSVIEVFATEASKDDKGADSDEIIETVTGPMNTLIDVITGVMAIVGVFMLIKGIMNIVNSIQEQDSSGTYRAGIQIASALLMISVKVIVALFYKG